MPGYGESPMLTTARADAGDYADALARMLDRAGVQKTVLVGHSLGALVAAAFAAGIRSACGIWCWPTSLRATASGSRAAGKSLAGASAADGAGR